MSRFAAVAIAAALLQGCATGSSLGSAKVEAFEGFPRNVNITDIQVVDARDPEERDAETPKLRYLVPFIPPIYWTWGAEGQYRPSADAYSADVAGEMKNLISKSLFLSRLAEPGPNAVPLSLRVELKHLYGTTHGSFGGTEALLNWFGSANRIYAPYGFAAANVELRDKQGRVLVRRAVTGRFNPGSADFYKSSGGGVAACPPSPEYADYSRAASGESPEDTTQLLIKAGVDAAGKLAVNIVRAIEPAVSAYPAAEGPADPPVGPTFVIARAAADGISLDIASIGIASGEIHSFNTIKRWMEPYSPVGEWVVDQYQGAHRRLTADEYEALVHQLSELYDVRFVRDVRVAHFFGMRPGRFGTPAPMAVPPPPGAPGAAPAPSEPVPPPPPPAPPRRPVTGSGDEAAPAPPEPPPPPPSKKTVSGSSNQF